MLKKGKERSEQKEGRKRRGGGKTLIPGQEVNFEGEWNPTTVAPSSSKREGGNTPNPTGSI